MKFSRKEVQDIALLARLELSEDELDMYAEQFSAVFDYISMLDELDTSNVEETSQVTGLEDVYRSDVIHGCDKATIDKLIEQFPDRMGDLLKVKGVFK